MRARWVPLLAVVSQLLAGDVFAHGIVGKRFFPATLTIDDPFVADELSLPTYSYQKFGGSSEDPAMSWRFFVQHYSQKDRQSSNYDSKYNDKAGGVFYPAPRV